MKKSELQEYIKEMIVSELSGVDERMFIGPNSADDLKNSSEFAAIKDKPAALNTLKAGESVTLEEDEDREPTKAELEKEKIKGAPSKFKIAQSDFENFKTTLKTLVKKIKDMEKGDERTKKMAALKQFIKKPELVKAFKERDVQIDTDDLVG
jgi:cell fate (sporulation/competence/biofilm development) regulator YlbF (YheA/YmcA/DUF963 family)